MTKLYIECNDFSSLMETLITLKELDILDDNLLKEVSSRSGKFQFPIKIDIPTEPIKKAKKNPLFKAFKLAFGKQIQEKTVDILNKALSPAE